MNLIVFQAFSDHEKHTKNEVLCSTSFLVHFSLSKLSYNHFQVWTGRGGQKIGQFCVCHLWMAQSEEKDGRRRAEQETN